MRVVVTGMGLVTPLGWGVQSVWDRLISGHSGIARIRAFDPKDFSSQIAGEIPEGLDFGRYIPPRDQKKMGRFIWLAAVATAEALDQADWHPSADSHASSRTGIIVGSGIGGLPEIEESARVLVTKGPRFVTPFFVPSSLINLASGYLSIVHGFSGPNISVVTACATGAHAIGAGADMIRKGAADVMVVGGTEAAICPLGVAGFASMHALSRKFNDDPQRASRPWDKARDGFVIAEGSGVLVLESYEHAVKRGATIYGEILGCGLSGDAHHITAPREDGTGAYAAMKNALTEANLSPSDIDYVNAHGTSTPAGDLAELRAMERLFCAEDSDGNKASATSSWSGDERASCGQSVKVSSTKSSVGHLLGAAGSVEAIFCLMAMNHKILPPTLNLDDPVASQLDLIPHKARPVDKVQYVLSNSFGFGGTNVSLVFGTGKS